MIQTLGAFEELVLLAVAGLGTEAYAVPVQQAIDQAGSRGASMGATYTALDRLEKKGLVASRMGPPTPERGGRSKRFYEITGAGREALGRAEETRGVLKALESPNPKLSLG